MAITNYDRVGKALELLKAGLRPLPPRGEREFKDMYKEKAPLPRPASLLGPIALNANKPIGTGTRRAS